MKKKVSIVVPVFNEEAVLPELVSRLENITAGEFDYDFEMIMVENGSGDKSFEILQGLRSKDERVKIVRLSRNFGCDGAITAGLSFVKSDAAIIMNADLQDPPELIPEFLRKWESGFDIVYGIIKKRRGESFLKRMLSSLFYLIINTLTHGLFPRNASDFRLISKKVVETVNSLSETNRFMRGMIAWSGFSQVGVDFVRPARFAGESKANFRTIFKLAMNGIFSFSYLPLRMTTFLGIFMAFFSFALMIAFVIAFFAYGRIVPGHTSIIVSMLFLFGILFFILGIIGEYLARIYDEVKGRPNFILEEVVGI